MAKFKVGDVVQLNSGGPLMTVNQVGGTDVYVTYYSEPEGKFRGIPNIESLKFYEVTLQAVE